jgi:F0F1-type ATP synthase assembly protein I
LLQQHYLGEFGKLAITLLMFGATFAWIKPLSAPPLFITYVLTLAAYWVALILFA